MAHKTGTIFSWLVLYSHNQGGYHRQINACVNNVIHFFSIFGSSNSSAMLLLLCFLNNEQKVYCRLESSCTLRRSIKKEHSKYKEISGGNQDRWGVTKIIYTGKNKEYFSSLALWLTGLTWSDWSVRFTVGNYYHPKGRKKEVMGSKV